MFCSARDVVRQAAKPAGNGFLEHVFSICHFPLLFPCTAAIKGLLWCPLRINLLCSQRVHTLIGCWCLESEFQDHLCGNPENDDPTGSSKTPMRTKADNLVVGHVSVQHSFHKAPRHRKAGVVSRSVHQPRKEAWTIESRRVRASATNPYNPGNHFPGIHRKQPKQTTVRQTIHRQTVDYDRHG